ncbi:GNAT family N-acetyltransferase [Nonomuraea sp. NPDC050556]|uniref:GNAT family N-acetyltransferase n=1 Tax=Nonomuraea sp. NPDC050556 TaxID=3364369 RepID=UPI00379B74FA
MSATDAPGVKELHERCSPESLHLRYLGPYPRIGERVIGFLTDPAKGTSLVTVENDRVVAMTNVMNTQSPGVVEVAFLVEDRWQGQGLGTALLQRAVSLATAKGAKELTACMFGTNRRMIRLLAGAGARLPERFGQVIEVRLPLSAGAPCR